jgi:hypothetical protein
MWRIGWAPNNTNKWQIGFNSAFKGLNCTSHSKEIKTILIVHIIKNTLFLVFINENPCSITRITVISDVMHLYSYIRMFTSYNQPLPIQIINGHFTFVWPCIVTNFFIIKPTRCTNITNLFWHETLDVSESSSVHHQEFIHCTLSNGICHTSL